jgi:hypothetical protein
MLDGTALPKPHNRSTKTPLAGRAVFTPQTLQAVLIVLGIALATFVLYLYVLPNSQMDAAKVRIAELRAEKARLERENTAVLQQIASISDLKTLEVKAKALGMAPTSNAIYLRLPSSAPAPTPEPTHSAIDQTTGNSPATLAEWLQQEHRQEIVRTVRWNVSQAVERVIQRFLAN